MASLGLSIYETIYCNLIIFQRTIYQYQEHEHTSLFAAKNMHQYTFLQTTKTTVLTFKRSRTSSASSLKSQSAWRISTFLLRGSHRISPSMKRFSLVGSSWNTSTQCKISFLLLCITKLKAGNGKNRSERSRQDESCDKQNNNTC